MYGPYENLRLKNVEGSGHNNCLLVSFTREQSLLSYKFSSYCDKLKYKILKRRTVYMHTIPYIHLCSWYRRILSYFNSRLFQRASLPKIDSLTTRI